LTKELRLKDISDIKTANLFLPYYLDKFNQKFTVKPTKPNDQHRPLAKGTKLEQILCRKETRVLSRNLTCQYHNLVIQVLTQRSAYTLRKTPVEIQERYDGTIKLFDHRGKPLNYTIVKTLPINQPTTAKELNAKVDAILIKQAKKNYRKKNPWESSWDELHNYPNSFYRAKGAV